MQKTPDSSTYVVIGGGVHGLSSAYHLALELEASGKGSGKDIVVLPEVQAQDCVAIQRHQAEIGYRSDVVLGERACTEHMQAIFPDWNGEGIEAVLHERQGGWAETQKTVE